LARKLLKLSEADWGLMARHGVGVAAWLLMASSDVARFGTAVVNHEYSVMANSTRYALSVLAVCKSCAYGMLMIIIARSMARAEPLHIFPMSGSSLSLI